VVEPARSDGNINFSRIPEKSSGLGYFFPAAQVLSHQVPGLKNPLQGILTGAEKAERSLRKIQRQDAPFTLSGQTSFIPHPANIRTHNGDDGLWLQFSDQLLI